MTRLAGFAQTVGIVFWLATASYALLASQAFTYEDVLRPELVPAVSFFARYHAFIAIGALLVYLLANVLAERPGTTGQRVALGLAGGVWAIAAATFFFMPVLVLSPGPVADIALFAALVPVWLIAAVDIVHAEPVSDNAPESRHAADFFACVFAALAAALITVMVAFARGAIPTPSSIAGIITTLVLHLVMFVGVFLCLAAVRAFAALAGSRRVELGAAALLMGGAFFLLLWRIVFPSFLSAGWWTTGIALAFAATLTMALAARGLRASWTEDDVVHRLTSAFSPRLISRSWMWVTAWMVLVGTLWFVVAAVDQVADWNAMAVRVSVVVVWLLIFSALVRSVKMPGAGEPAVFFGFAVLLLALQVGWTSSRADRLLASAGIARQSGTRAWITRDPAARLLTEMLTRGTTSSTVELP